MKCIKKMVLWLGLALALAGCNLNLTNDTFRLPESNIVLDNEYVQITVTENKSENESRASSYTKEHWAYSTTTVLFNGTSSKTSFYNKNSAVTVECKKEGTYNFVTTAYKADKKTPVAKSDVVSKNVKFSDGNFNLQTYLSTIYTYEGTEGDITSSWSKKPELKSDWFKKQSIVSKNEVKSIKLVANTTSISNYSFSWSGGENVTVYYNKDDSSITIATPGNCIFAPFISTWLFSEFTNASSIDIDVLDTSNVTNMSCMFYGCKSLTNLNLSKFDTSKVKSMNGMFSDCMSLTNLNLGNFNTLNVTNMSVMFNNCILLRSLNLSNFDTSNVTDMDNMFSSCKSLTSLNLNSFDTAKVNDMRSMFEGCKSLTSLNLSNFNTSNVIYMQYMFFNCSSLTSLNVNNFNTSSVTNMRSMFNSCTSLKSLDLSNFNTSKVSNMTQMFYYCTSLTKLNLSSFNTSNVSDMSHIFTNCSNLTTLTTKDSKLLEAYNNKL